MSDAEQTEAFDRGSGRWSPVTYLALLTAAWERHLAEPDGDAPTVVSTFAGGGGSSLGYSVAGYRELLATDHDALACESLRRNFAEPHGVDVVERGIGELPAEEVLERTGLERGELDVLDGSPPCQGFSTAGSRQVDDERNALYEEYARLLEGLRPRAMVVENVSGLVKGKMKATFVRMLRRFKAAGYRVRAWVLNAKYFHVPQSRARTIFVGVRDDLGVDPTPPRAESRPVTVREAIGLGGRVTYRSNYSEGGEFDEVERSADEPMLTIRAVGPLQFEDVELERLEGGLRDLLEARDGGVPIRVRHDTHGDFHSAGDISDRPCVTITVGGGDKAINRHHFEVEEVAEDLLRAAEDLEDARVPEDSAVGREAEDLEPGEGSERYFSLIRAPWDGPAPTIQALHGDNPSIAATMHPTETRKFTIPELKVLSSFPVQFDLPGDYGQKWRLVGNSVPPLFMEAISRHVRELLEEADG